MADGVARGVLAPGLRLAERLGYGPRLVAGAQRLARSQVGDSFGFGDYRPGAHDVIVCTYPKSGTNWMMQVVHQIATRGRGGFAHVHDVVPWPDAPGGVIPARLEDDAAWRVTPTGLRAVKTHLAWQDVPYTPDARYVHVVRDPKDVFVSGWFFFGDLVFGPLMPSVETWLELYVSEAGFGPVPACSWAGVPRRVLAAALPRQRARRRVRGHGRRPARGRPPRRGLPRRRRSTTPSSTWCASTAASRT